MHNAIVIFLMGHAVGDFYLQTDKTADNKKHKFRSLLFHCIAYMCAMLAASLIDLRLAWAAAIIGASHFAIDSLKFAFVKKAEHRYYFAIDQLLHVAAIVLTCYFFKLSMPKNEIINWACMLLLLIKPASISFNKMFSQFRPQEIDPKDEGSKNAGQTIGILERLITSIFLVIGQYAAIGLVFTAKSIARYKKISENQKFGEYYLIGTLYSLIYTIVTYFAVFFEVC